MDEAPDTRPSLLVRLCDPQGGPHLNRIHGDRDKKRSWLRSSSNPNERGIMSRVLFVMIGFGALVSGVRVSADEIDVDFTTQRYDRWLFRPEAGLDGGHWNTRGNGLHASVPKGQPSRGPLQFHGLMHLKGDFEIVADFEINSLPRPAEPPPKSTVKDRTNNIEIFLYPSCLLGGSQDYDSETVVTATSRHPGGPNLMTGDGSVRFVKTSINASVWTALGTIAVGEVIDASAY